jgi:hypothetical protein
MTEDEDEVSQSSGEPAMRILPETLDHITGKFEPIFTRVMNLAASKALAEHRGGGIYNVTVAHVDSALNELIPNLSELARDPDAGRIPKPKATHAQDVQAGKAKRGARR